MSIFKDKITLKNYKNTKSFKDIFFPYPSTLTKITVNTIITTYFTSIWSFCYKNLTKQVPSNFIRKMTFSGFTYSLIFFWSKDFFRQKLDFYFKTKNIFLINFLPSFFSMSFFYQINSVFKFDKKFLFLYTLHFFISNMYLDFYLNFKKKKILNDKENKIYYYQNLRGSIIKELSRRNNSDL